MKIRIAFGLDLDLPDVTLEDHERRIKKVADEIVKFYANDLWAPVEWTLRIVKATAVLEIAFPQGRQPQDLQVFGCFLPRFDIYRWINISKEL